MAATPKRSFQATKTVLSVCECANVFSSRSLNDDYNAAKSVTTTVLSFKVASPVNRYGNLR